MVPYTSLYHQYYKRYGGFGSRVSLKFTVLEGTVYGHIAISWPSSVLLLSKKHKKVKGMAFQKHMVLSINFAFFSKNQ